jgi:ABC-2 type transport system permease protein
MKEKVINYIKWYLIIISLCAVCAAIFHYAEGESLYYRESVNSIPETNGDSIVGELNQGIIIEQEFESNVNVMKQLGIMFSDYGRQNTNIAKVQLIDLTDNSILMEDEVLGSDIGTNKYYNFNIINQRNVQGHRLKIKVIGEEGVEGSAGTIVFNSQKPSGGMFKINGVDQHGTMSFSTIGNDAVWTGSVYWELVFAVLALITVLYILAVIRIQLGKKNYIIIAIQLIQKYTFLIQKLVSRDFKVKYKRSALGVVWSFLNPLLTMSMQYMIFSQLFKSDIKNYPVYLLSGVVMFNFFSEAVINSLMAIVGNASLITKVYVPKYIYPITKVFSALINLFIALIPLFIMVVFTTGKITRAFLLLPIPLICITVFSMGIGLMLCTAMVFFRDTQFLWGIFSMLWMYATPLFYPENILPDSFKILHKVNPLYYFIKMLRSIVLEGMGLEPKIVFISALMALGTLIIGVLVFRRHQDKFILSI